MPEKKKKNKRIFLVGPTASGKSSLSNYLANHFNLSIISMDSMQIYKWMDIGTSKPTKEERLLNDCYGFDICFPNKYFSVGDYIEYVNSILPEIYAKGNIPLFVGGTGLYYDALVYGLSDLPPRDEKIRNRYENLLKEKGIDYLLNSLKNIDLEYYNKISKTDSKRAIRALEVYEITGKKFSDFHKGKDKNSHTEDNKNSKYNDLKIFLTQSREKLYEKINKRVDLMMNQGLEEEVVKLLQKVDSYDKSSVKAIGYKEFIPYFEKQIDFEEVVRLIKRNSRRYAKRQFTWFKKDKSLIKLEIDNNIEQKGYELVKSFLERH